VAKLRRDDDFDDAAAPAGPPADAYVGLAAITLALLVGAGVLFYLDTDTLGGVKTGGPTFQVTAAVPAPAPAK
jgi:hypothetical protein